MGIDILATPIDIFISNNELEDTFSLIISLLSFN